MWSQVIYLLEIFATMACIHCIYGKKIKWDVKPIALCLSLLIIYEVANALQDGGLYSLFAYIPIFIYCRSVFGVPVSRIFIKMVWLIILLTSIEFFCVLLVVNFVSENLMLRNVLANFLLLIVSVFILPKIHIDKVSINNRETKFFLAVILVIILLMIFQGKIMHKINVTLFVLVIPILLMLLYILAKWSVSQAEVDSMKKELNVVNMMEGKYLELLNDIRLKQHGFKNHITAILSAHYTYKTYEKLVEVQDEYCNRLIQENRHNNLLQIGDKILVGFLYDKFREIEGDGVEVKYEINALVKEYAIPSHHLVEILGILLDNAMEAVKYEEKNIVTFIVSDCNDKYLFFVRNISKYVSYSEIENWFQQGVSSKGKGRGLGLYHVKKLCQKLGCEIHCRNIGYEQDNWIEFCLEIVKADRG